VKFITSNVCVCICVLSMNVCVYVVSMCDLGSLWTKGTWMIWEVCKWLWGSANDLIVCDYECRVSMTDGERMWALNVHKWLWMTMNVCEWLWTFMNMIWMTMNIEQTWMIVRLLNDLCEWFANVNKEWYVSENKEWSMSESENQSMNESKEWFVNECEERLKERNNLRVKSDMWMNDMWTTNI